MHRLQISLPDWQAQFLSDRATAEGISMAEVVRRLVAREAEARSEASSHAESVLDLAGSAEDLGPLLEGIPVSEAPERYLEPCTVDPFVSEVAEAQPGAPHDKVRGSKP